jgi:hypothetical protein
MIRLAAAIDAADGALTAEFRAVRKPPTAKALALPKVGHASISLLGVGVLVVYI